MESMRDKKCDGLVTCIINNQPPPNLGRAEMLHPGLPGAGPMRAP